MRDAIKCGFQLDNKYYVDKCLVFGAVNGTAIFQRISDSIRFMLAKEGIVIWNCIDDMFAAVESVGGDGKFQKVHSLVTELGLPLNGDKVQAPCTRLDIMGIRFDVTNFTISIP